MSKPIPTLSALVNQTAADIKSKLGILLALAVKLVVNGLAAVFGGQVYLCYLYLQDNQNNQFPDTADTEANGGTLERQGRMYLRRNPYPATDGSYTAAVTGAAGAVIRAQLTFKSNDSSHAPGFLYIIDAEYILTGADDVITLRSVNAGPDYLLNAGDLLTATEPVIGLNETATITGVTIQPVAAEDIEVYRQKILDALILEPQGGAKTDYRLWAADAQGVERVYPYVKNGDAGVVQVYVEATTVDSTDGKGTPGAGILDAVEAVIEFDPDTTMATYERGRRPMQAILEVLPITPQPVDVTITSLQTNTSAIQQTIRDNLAAYLYDVRPYIAGCDLPRDKNDVLTSVKLQGVVTDTIGNANTFLSFAMSVDGVPLSTYTFTLAGVPWLRNVTFS
jgi:uncharacterized phage protein gp47/JayE